jgi:hypothetical protein
MWVLYDLENKKSLDEVALCEKCDTPKRREVLKNLAEIDGKKVRWQSKKEGMVCCICGSPFKQPKSFSYRDMLDKWAGQPTVATIE